MIYVTKDGKYILQEAITNPGSFDTNDNLCFECDEMMTPIISTLLQKGYETKFCCSGHFYNGYVKTILDNSVSKDIAYNNGNDIITSTNVIELIHMEEKDLTPDIYIMFSSSVKDIPEPPEGWKIEYNVLKSKYELDTFEEKPKDDKYFIILRHDVSRYDEYKLSIDKPYEFMRKLMDINESLYNWALNLEDYRKE